MKNLTSRIALFVLAALFANRVAAQQVSGNVTDAKTGDPVPFMNVYYEGNKQVGTTTDINGYYKLGTDESTGKLVFSSVGYDTKVVAVPRGSTRLLNVKVNWSEKELGEVLVKPKKRKYSRKNNPAVELMRKVIAAKRMNDLKTNDFYKFNKYQRITCSLNGVTQAMVDSGLFKKLPFLEEQIEFCPQTGKNILPLNYNEKITQYLYRKNPKEERAYIRGTNSQGFNDLFTSGDLVNTAIRSVFTDINVYDNTIHMLERPFTSPLSSTSAITFYQFFIMDTIKVDKDRCIRLTFVPQNPQDFGFSGTLLVIDDGRYQVKQCTLNLPLRTSVNFVNNLVIEQTFGQLATGQRVLLTDNMFAELGVLKKHRSFMVKRTTSYTGFSFDSIPDYAFREKEKLREGTHRNTNEAFWQQHRTDTLSHSEANMGHALQTARNSRGFGGVMFVLKAFIENYVETAKPGHTNYVDIGPVNTIISTNFVEKVRLRASAQTTANLNPHIFLKGYAAYGFRDKKWKYLGQVEYSFLRKEYSSNEFPRNSITASVQYDVMSPTDRLLTTDKDNVFVSFKTETVDQMAYYRSYNLKYEYEFNSMFSTRLAFRHVKETPTGSLYYRTLSGVDVPNIKNSELTLALRYAPGEEVVNTKQRRHTVNHNNPVFTLTHTMGLNGFLGGEYKYNFSELSVYERLWMFSYGKLSIYAKAGAQWNKVPFPLLIMPAANNSYIIQRDMFCMMHNMEFLNDRYASLDVAWDLNGKLFNRIPLLKRLKWREVVGFKALYGTLTKKNNPAYHTGDDYLFEFPLRDGEVVSRPMGSAPYMELNVGIHNIFKILRIDYVRRLNYLHAPHTKKNGVRFVFSFNF